MQKFNKIIVIFFLLFNIVTYICNAKNPVRIKDIATIDGLKENQIMGIGLVVGLQGTGDSKSFKLTKEMLKNLAINYGFNITENDIEAKNVATVLVTANLSSFNRQGEVIAVSVSSIGDCKSLEGGFLLQTALKGADNNIYAVAQGKLLAGKRGVDSTLYATIPDGAIIERDVISNFVKDKKISLLLKTADFTTAALIRDEIVKIKEGIIVNIVDASKIEITLSEEEIEDPVSLISKIEQLTVSPDSISVVVIDKKSGTIVAGENIIIQECMVSIGNTQVNVKRTKNSFAVSAQNVKTFVDFLNSSGLTIDEIISILIAMQKAGSLNSKIIVL